MAEDGVWLDEERMGLGTIYLGLLQEVAVKAVTVCQWRNSRDQ